MSAVKVDVLETVAISATPVIDGALIVVATNDPAVNVLELGLKLKPKLVRSA